MEKQYDHIDSYITGNLPASEAAELERYLATDPELQAEFAFRQKLVTGLAAAHRTDLKNKFAQFAQQEAAGQTSATAPSAKVVEMQPRHASRSGVRRLMALAAGVAALVVAGYFVFNQGDKAVTAGGLFAQHFDKPTFENTIADRRGEHPDAAGAAPNASEKMLESAFAVFKAGDNEAALQLLEKINAADLRGKSKDDFHYVFGQLALEAGRLDVAAGHFEALSASPSYKDEVEWFSALMLLRQGASKQDLQAAFGKIAGSNSTYTDNAKAALQQIDRLKNQ